MPALSTIQHISKRIISSITGHSKIGELLFEDLGSTMKQE